MAISNQTGMVQHDVFEVVQRTLDHITNSLANNVAVELRNFGVFQPRLTKPRVGRNPNEPGSSFVIPPRATVKFKAGKIMRQRVEKLSRELKEASDKQAAEGATVGRSAVADRASICWLTISTARFWFQQVLDRFFQAVEIDRFGQVFRESGGTGTADIVLHAEPAKGYSAQPFCRAQLLHQLVAGSIWQADIADNKVEFFVTGSLHGLVGGVSERDSVSAPFQHHFHPGACIEMIVHHEDAALWFCRSRAPCQTSPFDWFLIAVAEGRRPVSQRSRGSRQRSPLVLPVAFRFDRSSMGCDHGF